MADALAVRPAGQGGALDEAPQIQLEDRAAWRQWLAANHAAATGVWLVGWRPATGRPRISFKASIEEALCFGWIDGRSGSVDELRSKLYFAPRRRRSTWGPSNKDRYRRMLAAGQVMPAGLAAVARARFEGTWVDE